MVQLSTTRSYRFTRQATVNWVSRASLAALKSRQDDQMQWTLDNVLQFDPEHANWWTSPKQDDIGPLFKRELTEAQPRWLNAANRAGFFAGLHAWNWSRVEGLSELLPDHYFKVRYELDRENGNQYLRTVLEAHAGVEPAAVVKPFFQEESATRAPFGRGVRNANARDQGETGTGGRNMGGGRNVNARGQGATGGRNMVGGRGGRGRGTDHHTRGSDVYSGGRGRALTTDSQPHVRRSGRGGPYRPTSQQQQDVTAAVQEPVSDPNAWATKLKSKSPPKTATISDTPQ